MNVLLLGGTGRTGGPPRSEAPSHATSRMTSDVNAKSVHSDRSDTLLSGAGHGSGAATPAAAAASSAAGSGARPRSGRNRIAGRMPTSGKPGTPRGPSPSSVPSFKAPVGQAVVQAGVPPSRRRWLHSVHFPITPLPASKRGASYGHTQLQ